MAYSNSIMTSMRSMNSKGLQELVASCLIIIILVGIVYAILSDLLHDMPTDEEDSIDQLTRANTAKNRRSKHTTINHFAANSINIHNGIDSTVSQRQIASIGRKQQVRDPTPPRRRRTKSAHIQFRTPEGPARGIIKNFPLTDPVEKLFEWVQSSPCPFQGNDGMEFSLICEEKEEKREIRYQRHSTIGDAELDACVVLVKFWEPEAEDREQEQDEMEQEIHAEL